MVTSSEVCVPLILRCAQDEVLLALSAETDALEAEHRRLADGYIRKAIRSISDNPERAHDWSGVMADS